MGLCCTMGNHSHWRWFWEVDKGRFFVRQCDSPGLFAIPPPPLQGVLKGSVSPESPALNWPAGQKRAQDRKTRLPTGAGVRALDAWDSAMPLGTKHIRLSRLHPLGGRPVNPPDSEA